MRWPRRPPRPPRRTRGRGRARRAGREAVGAAGKTWASFLLGSSPSLRSLSLYILSFSLFSLSLSILSLSLRIAEFVVIIGHLGVLLAELVEFHLRGPGTCRSEAMDISVPFVQFRHSVPEALRSESSMESTINPLFFSSLAHLSISAPPYFPPRSLAPSDAQTLALLSLCLCLCLCLSLFLSLALSLSPLSVSLSPFSLSVPPSVPLPLSQPSPSLALSLWCACYPPVRTWILSAWHSGWAARKRA